MHEVGIAHNLIEQVEIQLTKLKEPIKLLKITVSLGEESRVSAEALRFGFELAKKDSSIPFAELRIREVPIRLACPFCRRSFYSQQIEECPSCCRGPLEIVAGKELRLEAIEYE